MGTTPRTYDDGRNDKQRAKHDEEIGKDRNRLLDEKPFDFIEKTKPEDRLGEVGQQTRDNVNPAIPSAESGGGGIVDPRSLGMESQGGVAPPAATPYAGENVTPDMAAAHMPSINEPFGSDLTAGDAGPAELPPLVLSDITPDAMVVGSGTFLLTVTGSGFGPNCIVVFDDADQPTTYVSPTELTADCPVAAAAAVVDVEVHRGEEMSDVLTFEFTAVARMGAAKREQKPQKKPADKRKKSKK